MSGTTNPLLLALAAVAMVTVVLVRRTDAPWARSVRSYLLLAAFVVGMRVFFQVTVGAGGGETVLLTLPEVPLPTWAAGIRLGGAVTAEGLAATLYDATRLAVMLLCIGAANALANPRRALRSVPAALYEVSVAVVVALSVAPQLIESAQRVRRARRLRGDVPRGPIGLARVALPVLGDAIERSVCLAAGMESRGFGRTRGLPVRGTLPAMLASVCVSVLGVFLLLSTSWWPAAVGLLGVGITGTAWGLRRAGGALRVTSHRPHPWRFRDTLVAASGVAAALVVLVLGWLDPTGLPPSLAALLAPGALHPSTDPLQWPQLTVPMLAVVALVLAPLALTRPARFAPVATRRDTRVRSLRPRTASELVRG